MTHLSPEQIVDAAEGRANAVFAAHARECEACRAQVESVRDAVRLAESDQAPEPSPLFWPHLAARIGEAVRQDRDRVPAWQAWAWRLAPVGAVAVLVLAVGIGLRVRPSAPGEGAPVAVLETAAPAAVAPAQALETGEADDPSWTLVSDLSAQVSLEDAEASGELPPPGGAEKALLQLDVDERTELARILRQEIAARTPGTPPGSGA